MRTFKFTLLLLSTFTFMILNGCTTSKKTAQYKRQWMLVSFKDYTKEYLTENKASLNLSPIQAGNNPESGTAYMGCNNIRLKAKFSNGSSVTFSDLVSTLMSCPGNLENDFSKEIEKITDYKIEGHYLYLYNGRKQQMKFIAADWD